MVCVAQVIITLELRFPVTVVFRVDEEKFNNLAGWDEKKQKKVRARLSEEISFGLQSALSGRSLVFFLPFIDSDQDREQAELITGKTKEILISGEIESLSRLKHSSKNKVIQSLDWEVNVKKRDRKLGQFEDAKYATICLWYTQPTSKPETVVRRLFAFPGSENADKSLTLDLHPYEIKGLIEDFSKILKSLDE